MLTQPSMGLRCHAVVLVAGMAGSALLTGCMPAAQRPPPAPAAPTAPVSPPTPAIAGPSPPAGATSYRIDPQRTVVTIIVRRAGALARLGHDHVVTSADETGAVWLGSDPAASGFQMTLPVEKFMVDLPADRAAAGPEFDTAVPDAAREGTRTNMLRAEVLDGARFPVITVHSRGAQGAWPDTVARIGVIVKDRETELDVPLHVDVDAHGLIATGTLQLRQTQLGIVPFSVAGGAIQVADVLEIRFEIAATAAP